MEHPNRTRARTVFPLAAAFVSLSAGLPLGAAARAQEVFDGVSLKILNTRSPAGGMTQLLVTLTEPKPIVTGIASLSFDSGVLGPVMGVALYSPAGAQSDVAGTAVVSGGRLTVRTTSPGAEFGTGAAVPILAVAISVHPDALPTAESFLALDPAGSSWLDPTGVPYAQHVKSGKFQVGGSLSISDVFPGTGLLPAGSTVNVRGLGFVPGSIVEIDGVPVTATTLVSSTQLDVTIGADSDLYGRRVTVKNPDLARTSYFSYLRAAWLGQSSHALVAATDPIFSPQAFSSALFATSAPAGKFFAVALQNPGASPAQVQLDLLSDAGAPVASQAVTLGPRTRFSRDLLELFGATAASASVLSVRSTSPVQSLGLLGDEAAATVEPVTAWLALP